MYSKRYVRGDPGERVMEGRRGCAGTPGTCRARTGPYDANQCKIRRRRASGPVGSQHPEMPAAHIRWG